MKKLHKSVWPILIVSEQLGKKNDTGFWLDKIVKELQDIQECSTLLSSSYSDTFNIIKSREDLGVIILDWDVKVENEKIALIKATREKNSDIPILIITNDGSIEELPNELFNQINGTIWKFSDTPEFLSGRIENHLVSYVNSVVPPFFKELVKYVSEYKYAWHTPGHMGGQGFLRSPSGTAFHKFFGEDVLRADLSISVPELGSLLDHTGVTGEAEKFSSQVFGSDQTYYVLNGTSNANQIIWRSEVSPKDIALVDRNCHKSLNYAMVITDAKPKYMIPFRNKMGIIGPVDFTKIQEFEDGEKIDYKMSALTNSTYDGICYNINGYVKDKLKIIKNWHFDEAWYAYAKFHPIYKDHFAMELESDDKIIFASHSTHKLLTAFSQASMLHVKLPKKIKSKPNGAEFFKTRFNESYMMHGSTSPQYNMIASLEVATKMMYDNGKEIFNDTIKEAIELRRKIISIKNQTAKDDWFFGLWQPHIVGEAENIDELINQESWLINPKDEWHGFKFSDTKSYTMLDPIKLTFTTPGFDVKNGVSGDFGIPASIVTNFLIDRGIVCEKTDYYSWLLLNSLGTTRGKQGTLIAELLKFKQLFDSNALLSDVFPNLVKKYPNKYEGVTLKEHALEMHKSIMELDLLNKMNKAFEFPLPKQIKTPAEAYRAVVENRVKYMRLDEIKEVIEKEDREVIAGVMLVPYPPGIPIMMGGESFKEANNKAHLTLEYLIAREEFEFKFPGYVSDIHGIERSESDERGKVHFKTLVINEE